MATLAWLLLGICATVVLSDDPMEACADKNRSCKSRQARGWCKASGSAKKFMEKYCRRSCGMCEGGTVNTDKPIPSPTTPACADTATLCSKFKSRGYCNSKNYYHRRLMNRYCRKSCGKCGDMMSPSDKEHAIDRPKLELQNLYNPGGKVSTTKPAKPPTTPACADKNYQCPTWRLRGWCKNIFKKRFMEKNCRQSCRKCGACADATWYCSSWKSRGWCKSSRYKKFMEVNCKRTCGMCGGGKVTTNKPTQSSIQPPTTPACADKYKSCPTWQSLGFCKDIRYKRIMEEYCRKSCEKCGGGKITTNEPSHSPTPQLSTPACADKFWHCSTWGSRGLCKNSLYQRFMEKNCKKSCGKCGGSVTTQRPTQGPTEGPTQETTQGPTGGRTEGPTGGSTGGPTEGPTGGPTEGPTGGPTEGPTEGPTGGPTEGTKGGSTAGPTEGPTERPTEGQF